MSRDYLRPILSVNIYVACPHCKKTLDLFEEDDVGDFAYDEEHDLAECWQMVKDFVNNAENTEHRQVNCEHCKGTFPVNHMEW